MYTLFMASFFVVEIKSREGALQLISSNYTRKCLIIGFCFMSSYYQCPLQALRQREKLGGSWSSQSPFAHELGLLITTGWCGEGWRRQNEGYQERNIASGANSHLASHLRAVFQCKIFLPVICTFANNLLKI